MKKILTILLIILSFTLAGCSDQELENRIDILENDLTRISELEDKIAILEDKIAILEEEKENYITIESMNETIEQLGGLENFQELITWLDNFEDMVVKLDYLEEYYTKEEVNYLIEAYDAVYNDILLWEAINNLDIPDEYDDTEILELIAALQLWQDNYVDPTLFNQYEPLTIKWTGMYGLPEPLSDNIFILRLTENSMYNRFHPTGEFYFVYKIDDDNFILINENFSYYEYISYEGMVDFLYNIYGEKYYTWRGLVYSINPEAEEYYLKALNDLINSNIVHTIYKDIWIQEWSKEKNQE